MILLLFTTLFLHFTHLVRMSKNLVEASDSTHDTILLIYNLNTSFKKSLIYVSVPSIHYIQGIGIY